MEALKKATFDRTSIRIAHRLSTVIDADEILVLKNGRIVEKGKHKELIASPSSMYFELWYTQNRKLEK